MNNDNNRNRLANAALSYFVAPSFLASLVIALYNIATSATQSTLSDHDQETTVVTTAAETDQGTTTSATSATTSGSMLPLMSEPEPSKVMVRQSMPPSIQRELDRQAAMNYGVPLDRDIMFISGETEMPLSVYESPLMNAYRTFASMERDPDSDGFYVVHRRRIVPRRFTTHDGNEDDDGYDENESENKNENGQEQQQQEEAEQQQQQTHQNTVVVDRSYHRSPINRSIDALLRNETEEDLYGDRDDSETMLLYGRGPVFDLNKSQYYSIKADRFEGFDD